MKISIYVFIILLSIEESFADIRCNDGELFPHLPEIKLTIIADFNKINDRQLETHQKEEASSEAEIILNNKKLDYKFNLHARGAFRFEECNLRPINIEISKEEAQSHEYPFGENFKKLKLVTPCDGNINYRDLEVRKMYKEYLSYKILNILSDASLMVREVQLKFVGLNGAIIYNGPGFIRETEKNFAKRCGVKERDHVVKKWNNERRTLVKFLLNKDGAIRLYDYVLDRDKLMMLEFFNRLILNIDYHIDSNHNVLSFVEKNQNIKVEYLVPYDFDLAGFAGGTFYTYNSSVEKLAFDFKQWVISQSDQKGMKKIVSRYNLSFSQILNLINESKLDKTGKDELLSWLNYHQLNLL